MSCLICERISLIEMGTNPLFVKELRTGYVVIGDHQFCRGYTLFLSKVHATELHELTPDFRREFLWDMSQVAEAVYKAFSPDKLNYELLGNTDSHLHWHLFPRYRSEEHFLRPVWVVPKEVREAVVPTPEEQQELVTALAAYL